MLRHHPRSIFYHADLHVSSVPHDFSSRLVYGIKESNKRVLLSARRRYLHFSHLASSTRHQTYNIELPLAPAQVQAQLSNKHNLVLYVDQELIEKSRNLGFNLSKTFENHLKHLITQFSHVNSSNNIKNNENQSEWWAGPDSNRRPSARQADVLPS